jgi:hypothetical protein
MVVNDKLEDVRHFNCEVLDIEENHIIMKCIICDSPVTYQVRRFDKSLLNDIKHEIGGYVTIKATTANGLVQFEFLENNEDLSEQFKQEGLYFNTMNQDYKERFLNEIGYSGKGVYNISGLEHSDKEELFKMFVLQQDQRIAIINKNKKLRE